MAGPTYRRSGIRGVSIDDVADVAQNGSSVMRGGYTFTRRPKTQLPSVKDIIGQMTSAPLNTAGQKYSGFPTASDREAAVLGSLVPFYALGDYAAQLASQRESEISAATASDVRRRFGPGMLEQNRLGPIAIPGVGNVAPPEVARGNELDPAYQAAELARNQAWKEYGLAKVLGGVPQELADLQDLVDNGLELYPEEKARYDQLWAERRRQQQDLFSLGEAARQTNADLALASRNATSARLAGATGAAAQAAQQVAAEVTPYSNLAADIYATPRYELAQQMATQYFGMDPALAAGTFTPEVDIKYINQQLDYQAAQNLAMGINPNASIEDTLLAMDPSGQQLLEYQQMRANAAMQKEQEGMNTAAEDDFDANLAVATGFSVRETAGDLPLSTARAALQDPDFLDAVGASVEAMRTAELGANETPKDYADSIVREYVAQGASPVYAVMLANILANFSFLPLPYGN